MARVVPGQLELEAPPPQPLAQRRKRPSTARNRRSATDLLNTPGALLTRSHLRELGLERRAVDAVFRALPIVVLPGYTRPMIRAEQFLALVDDYTYSDDRVRPTARG